MLSKIKKIFEILNQVLAVYAFVITMIELGHGDEEGEEKKKKAIDWLREAGQKLVEKGIIPEWAYNIFFDNTLLGWLIDILVRKANELGFFTKEKS